MRPRIILCSVLFLLSVKPLLAATIGLGIPSPGGQVPSAIMPTLPTSGTTITAFPYDPINIATPVWADGASQYYVDSNHASCDDANNSGRGSDTLPRCTIPGIANNDWALAAGSQVFIKGDGASYGNGANFDELRFTGTAADPVWLIGLSTESEPRWTNQPQMDYERVLSGEGGTMTHVIFHNLHWHSEDPNDHRFLIDSYAGGDPFEYITFRQSTCSGAGLTVDGGVIAETSRRCISLRADYTNPIKFVVIHDMDMFGVGRWVDDYSTSKDMHAVQIEGPVYYFWIMNSRIFHMQGDSFQCSNSNKWDFDKYSRPHYIYIGQNEFYENYENGYDSKGCYHVVFSENYVHDFYNSVKPANASGIITAQDNESHIGDAYAWFLNNRIERTGDAFAYKGTQDDAFPYVLGNIAVNLSGVSALPIEGRCYTRSSGPPSTCGNGTYMAMNTFDCGRTQGAARATRSGLSSDPLISFENENQEITFIGNIFNNCTQADNDSQRSNGSPHGYESINANFILTYKYNVDYRDFSYEIQLSRYTDIQEGNLLNVNPGLTNPTNDLTTGDYRPKVGSMARRLVTVEPAAYSLFESMYGHSIRQDLDGVTWEAGAVLTPGAYQSLPLAPVN